ncbi:MAG: hypothetical protein NT099_02365 [Candidatus Saganbacteria bacterium]|nr:hypothetical protein [Candidatus Saganbacteria bacterium]
MDKFSPVYELLSELESVPLERFLYQAGARLGSQIKKMHDQKMTLHQSNGNGKAPDEPLFSCLCAHSVEIHGNIVDVEGLRPIDPREHSLRVRAADVQGVLGGVKTRNLFQSASMSLFYAFALAGKSLDNFSTIAAGIFHGYAGASEPADKERITAVVRQAADATGAGRADVKPAWPYDFTYKILEWMEQGMQG